MPTRKSEALFAYLIERGGEGVSREALSTLLWPYSGEDQARASLRQEILVLRKGLGADFDDIVDLQGDRVSVTQRGLEVDIWALRAHRRLGHDPGALLALLAQYTAPFLDTFRIRSQPFSDWVWATRQSLEAEMLSLGQAALSRCEAEQDVANTTQIAVHLCRVEPTYEPAHQALIAHHLHNGDMAAAQRQLRQCETALKGFLDTGVSAETLALFADTKAAPPDGVSDPVLPNQQRRFVTVFAAAANLDIADPEDFDREAAIVSDMISRHVTAKGGTVLSVSGGDVLACFGYPVAHDKDSETATFAAMDLSHKLNAGADGQGGTSVQIGLSHGMVLISEAKGKPKLTGGALRAAEALARKGTLGAVTVCAETARAVTAAFDLRPLGSADGAQQVLRQNAENTQADGVANVGPLIGRADPLEQLTTLLRQAKLGYGSAAAVLGDPGQGKSRLVQEVTQIGAGLGFDVQLFQGRLSAQQSTFAPVLAQMIAGGEFSKGQPSSAELKAWLQDRSAALVPAMPFFEALFRSWDPAMPAGERVNNAAKDVALELFVQSHCTGPRQRPTILVFEDVQWFDLTTRDSVTRLIEAVSSVPVLVILVSRIAGAPEITALSDVRRITLDPLGPDNAAELLRGNLGSYDVSPETLANVLERSDGNPLILEEFAKAIVFERENATAGDVTQSQAFVAPRKGALIAAPSRILPLLLSRIDAVPGAIQTLQYACVFGREFSGAHLAAILKPARAGADLMTELVATGILEEAADATGYWFNHALIAEAIYSTIPKTGRPKMHTAAAEALLGAGNLVNLSEVARHYKAAAKHIEAVKYFTQAGDSASQVSAPSEAVSDYHDALDMAAQLPATVERQRTELTLNSKMAAQLIALHGIPTVDVLPYYEQALALSQALRDDDAMTNVIWVGWSIQLMVADLDACLEIVGKLAPMGHTAATPVPYIIEQYMRGVTQAYRGSLTQAAEHLEAVLAVYNEDMKHELQLRFGMDIALTSNSFLGWVYALSGRASDADKATQNALAMAQANNNALSLVFADIFTATKCLFLDEIDTARHHAERAYAGANDMGFKQWSAQARIQLARIADLSGDPEALPALLQAQKDYLSTGMSLARPYLEVWIAEAQVRQGSYSDALATLDVLAEYTERSAEKYFDFAQTKAREFALAGK